ncbi:SHOCT domain-containing protein [Amycolatopsis acidicola]|uniref:SHOCT domain-containing protein n=1 Tax=Amycolatopsis acidicola TaxID=2596893 RepID=A0A5N0VCI2_9PSEU|nr:SHOCT domain-containing protein [Amycolatopsis acidicola]KAA9162591.1 SHOCT domain-containing protein [Amycolatopsis acidicola]
MLGGRRFGRPGLLGTMARTAVVAGTAKAVTGRMQRRADERDAAEQARAQQAALQSQAELAQVPGQSGGSDLMSQLERLNSLHTSGVLNDQEFAAAKAKLLGT